VEAHRGEGAVPITAYTILHESRLKAAEDGSSLQDTISTALIEYDKLPFVMRSKDGYLFRRGKAAPRKLKSKPVKERRTPREQKAYDMFWEDIRTRTDAFLMSTLPNTDPVFVTSLQQELTVMLRIVAKDFKRAMANAIAVDEHTARMERINSISTQEVRDACTILKMDPPEDGTPVDMEQVKRNKWRLAKEYHPDKTHRDTSGLLHAVLDSVSTLEQYNAQLKKEGQNGDLGG
jgi:hypothetical protein